MNIREDRILYLFFAGAVLVALAVFIVGQRHIPVSTDESILALQARHVLFPPADPDLRDAMHPKPVFHRFPLLFMAQPYLFPLEAYIAAPFAPLLPTNPFGARIVPLFLGLGALFLSFLILRRLGSWREAWPGALLLIFPSAYVAMLQYGYALPSYPSHLFFLALATWLTIRYIERATALRALGLGIVCAAALAGQLMALPLVLMCGVLVFWAGPGWHRFTHAALLGGAACTGWVPYILARKLYPGAYDAVSGSWPLREALNRIWAPLLNHVLPVACGIQSTVFPDNREHVEWLPWLTTLWPYLWLLLLVVVIAFWCWRLWGCRLRLEADASQAFIIFAGLSVAAIFLFALSRRSHSHTYRYMLTAAWALPFLFAYVHARLPWRRVRRAVAVLVTLLALLNAATLFAVMRQWAQPGFAADEAWLYDAGPALKLLEEQELTAVYASYHLAYRLTYGSGEQIAAAQYFNERFPGWPLPYRSFVDQAERPAYVMAPRFAITADQFEADLQATGITYTKAAAGELTVFHDFGWDRPGTWLRPAGWQAQASHAPEQAAALINGNPVERWRARTEQEPGMWVSLSWDEPHTITAVYAFYDFFRHDRADVLGLDAWLDGEWVPIVEEVPMGLDALLFEQDRPLYGHEFQRMTIPPTRTTALRLRIVEPAAGRDWAIGDLRLWGLE
jgi:hypothetical protein